MTKKIYYYELLELIHQHKQPKYIWYNHKKFKWVHCNSNYIFVGDYITTLTMERLSNVFGIKDIDDNVALSLNLLETILPKFKVEIELDLLDSTEKKYLYNIVKPYLTEYYITVMKISHPDNKENITIFLNDLSCPATPIATIELPKFEKGSMYKGMGTKNAIYDLSELGVCCEY